MAEKSKLFELGKELREKMVKQNKYKENNQYDETHPDAKSDGDKLGREDSGSGLIGTSIDIAQRNKFESMNEYTANNTYEVIE